MAAARHFEKLCQNTISQWLILVEFVLELENTIIESLAQKLGCYGKCPGSSIFAANSTGLIGDRHSNKKIVNHQLNEDIAAHI